LLTAPSGVTAVTNAAFTFTGSDNVAVARYDCRLDGGIWAPCASPVNYNGLSGGSHTFEVRAIDIAGNPDPSPILVSWVINRAPVITASAHPAQPDLTDTLYAIVDSITDDDGDPVTLSYTWYKDGVEQGYPATQTTVVAANTGENEQWVAAIVPNDGYQDGKTVYVTFQMPIEFSDISVGDKVSCGVSSTKHIYCWGQYYYGILGRDPLTGKLRTQSKVPIKIGTLSDVVKVRINDGHGCALTETGRVWCWGLDGSAQLGDGSGASTSCYGSACEPSPVEVNTASLAADIVVGYQFSCLLTTTNQVECWGGNASGQVGIGSGASVIATPTALTSLGTSVAGLSAGGMHACAVLSTGAVKCWGANQACQVGDGTQTNRSAPVAVMNMSTGVASVSNGEQHSCALKTDGSVKCWGINVDGELGTGAGGFCWYGGSTPAGLTAGVAGLYTSSGSHSHCARMSDDSVRCWGQNHGAQLANGTSDLLVTPQTIPAFAGAATIAVGRLSACLLTENGGVQCSGAGTSLGIGDGGDEILSTPTPVLGWSNGAASLDGSCIVTSGGAVRCRGTTTGETPQYGAHNDYSTVRSLPVIPTGLGTGISRIADSGEHRCALTSGGGVKCWGDSWSGEVGTNVFSDSVWQPANVSGMSSGVARVAIGVDHSCAILNSGALRCWGNNMFGQVGDNSTTNRGTPVSVPGMSSAVSDVSVGRFHTCALKTSGLVYCWGYNNAYQLTNTVSYYGTAKTPQLMTGLPANIASIVANWEATCAITAGGAVYCWGDNTWRVLRSDTHLDVETPTLMTGLESGVVKLGLSATHGCVLTNVNTVSCWGRNSWGQLGNGSADAGLYPLQQVAGLSNVTALSVSDDPTQGTCVLANGGAYICWGIYAKHAGANSSPGYIDFSVRR
jgi:alpha-tubulin suppressor-like RCC1 family protein